MWLEVALSSVKATEGSRLSYSEQFSTLSVSSAVLPLCGNVFLYHCTHMDHTQLCYEDIPQTATIQALIMALHTNGYYTPYLLGNAG